MASGYRQRAGSPDNRLGDRREDNNDFKHDTGMLLVHAKTATEAAKIMKKTQTKIERKLLKASSKELPKCIDKYNDSLKTIKDAGRQIEDLVREDRVTKENQGLNRNRLTQSMTGPRKRSRLEEKTFNEQQSPCTHCLRKDNKIKELEENLKSSSIKGRENEENLEKVLRSNSELQQQYKSERNKCKQLEDKHHIERKEKEDVLHSSQRKEEETQEKFFEIKAKEIEEKLENARRLNIELQQRCESEVERCKQFQDKFQKEKKEKENILHSSEKTLRSNNELQWQYQSEVEKRKQLEEKYDNEKENARRSMEAIRLSNNELQHRYESEKENRKQSEDKYHKERQKKKMFFEGNVAEVIVECMETLLRSNNELQQRYESEVEKCRQIQDKFDKESKEKENIIRSFQIKEKENQENLQRNDELQQRYEAERNQREHFKQSYKEEQAAKDDALRRLSSMASSKLRDNNPNITDLSDQNRPTKIAEKMSELYDNQWTDAFDALEGHVNEERQIIQILLDTLMDVYRECSRLASENFFERVQRSIETPVEGKKMATSHVVLPDQLKQQVKEFRKARAPAVVKEIKEVVKNRIKVANQELGEIQAYISSCIEIGWLAAVQDPPLVLKAQASAAFDTNAFKDYTRRGKYTEFVVWPTLYLHDGGAQLAKGVAQGCDHVQASNT